MSLIARLSALLWERFTLGVPAAVAALAVFVLVAYDVAAGGTRRLDVGAVAFLKLHRSASVYVLTQGVSLLASGGAQALVAAACLVAIWRFPRTRPAALSMLVAICGGEGLVYGLKALFHRPRPDEIYAPLGYSFPSGHSFFAVTLYGLAACWLTPPTVGGPAIRRWVWSLAILLILLIAFSRVYLGVHYPSDVLAGVAVAVPWVWACLALPKAFARLLNPARRS